MNYKEQQMKSARGTEDMEQNRNKHFEPFERVLVFNGIMWVPALYGFHDDDGHVVIGGGHFNDDEITAYEGNEALAGTSLHGMRDGYGD